MIKLGQAYNVIRLGNLFQVVLGIINKTLVSIKVQQKLFVFLFL